MRDYNNFNVEDYLEDSDFRDWVYKGHQDTFWQEWFLKHPNGQENMLMAKKILLSIRGDLVDIKDVEISHKIEEILKDVREIEASKWPNRKTVFTAFSRNFVRIGAAALLILALGLGWIVFKNTAENDRNLVHSGSVKNSNQSTDLAGLIKVSSQTHEEKLVNLPDGSSVLLMGASELRYPASFTPEKREVYLSGEAFFEVHKNSKQPFYVYANELVARVLGTSFVVRARGADDKVSVRVKTGKVSVSHAKASEETLVRANQQAIMSRENLQIVKNDISKGQHKTIPIEVQEFNFSRVPAGQVFETMEKMYGIAIEYDKTLLQNCTITAFLSDEPLMEKLGILCQAIDATYEMDGSRFVISAKGCQ
ncbi:FecR family protein [Marinilongibacter aquaticus]|uniref:FecR family protein n=1 Tax=Marinilongibacter aquaticus TaxID=2975157 RepID=UPI0021BD1B86|nr:FecR family protein [Marinilongibacter aquaticus]UBM58661.1 FecR family protein [Marinilongibacter aquaticus]